MIHLGSCVSYDAQCCRRERRAGHLQASSSQELRGLHESVACMYVYTQLVYLVFTEVRRGPQIPWHGNYRWL